jgi:geranylgeranyl diphosphate synthase type I
MAAYKQAIDADIAAYSAHVRQVTKSQYGTHPAAVTEEFLDLLERGGKRIRGALVMVGYEMLGGRDRQMIVRAATAVEMMHASMLIVDDMQDQDDVRRGKPAVHAALAAYHKKLKLHGEQQHTGMSLALNAALGGVHAAQMLLAGLNADPQLRLNVIGIISHTIIITLHGQTFDVINAKLDAPKQADIDRAREWKSAHYTFLNPLCVGMVLAGAGCEDTDAIRDYALNTGIAFQLADDLMDGDIPAGQVAASRQAAAKHVDAALTVLAAIKRPWDKQGVAFLQDLARFVVTRQQ